MSNGEIVNGPKVAADIIKAMSKRQKDKVFRIIAEKEPELAEKITANMFAFDEIVNLSSQDVQILLRHVDYHDLLLSFKLASTEAQNFILKNMSKRRRSLFKRDFNNLGKQKKALVLNAQRKIIEKMHELQSLGLIKLIA